MYEFRDRIDASQLELKDTVVSINRVTKVVKGGKNLSFSALVIVGDNAGHVGFGDGAHAPVVQEPAAVEHDTGDALVLQALGEDTTDSGRPLDVASPLAFAELALDGRLGRARRRHGRAVGVVDGLDIDVRHAAEHGEPRPGGVTGQLLPQTQADTLATVLLGFNLHGSFSASARYFAPALPAFFLSTSPVYRTPFCLYGSGLRSDRMLAATWPTSCLSMPVTVTCVCFSMATSMP